MRVQCAFIVKLQCLWIKILFTHLQLSIGVAHTSIHNVLRFSICIRKIVQLFFWFRRFLERHKPQFQAAQRCIKKWNGCKAWTKCSTRNPITKRTFVLHYTVTMHDSMVLSKQAMRSIPISIFFPYRCEQCKRKTSFSFVISRWVFVAKVNYVRPVPQVEHYFTISKIWSFLSHSRVDACVLVGAIIQK